MTSVSWTGITIDKRQDTTHSVERQVVGAEVFWFKPSTQLVSFDDFLQLDEEYYRIIDDVAIPRRLGPDWEVEQGSPPETVTTYDLPYIKLALGMVSPIREQRGHIWGVKSTRSTTIELFDVSKIDGKVMTYAPALRIADSPIMFEYADETYSEF